MKGKVNEKDNRINKNRVRSPTNPISNSINSVTNQNKIKKYQDMNILDHSQGDINSLTERIYRNTPTNNTQIRENIVNSSSKSPKNSPNKSNLNNTNLNKKPTYITQNAPKTTPNHPNSGRTPIKTISKTKIINTLKTSKTSNLHENSRNNTVTSNHYGPTNKSIEFKNEILKQSYNPHEVTASIDNNLFNLQHDFALDSSEIIMYSKLENKKPFGKSITDKKSTTSKTKITRQNLILNDVKQDSVVNNYSQNNVSPNYRNNTIKKTSNLKNKNERNNTPTNADHTTNNSINQTNKTYADKNKNMQIKSNPTNQSLIINHHPKTNAVLYAEKNQNQNQTITTRKFKINNTENIVNEYKNTLKNNKLYINTDKDDPNKKTFVGTYTKNRLNSNGIKNPKEIFIHQNVKNNISPDRTSIEKNNASKKINFQEPEKSSHRNLKDFYRNENNLNSSFNQPNEKVYFNQTMRNNIMKKSLKKPTSIESINDNKIKKKNKSSDKNDFQFESFKKKQSSSNSDKNINICQKVGFNKENEDRFMLQQEMNIKNDKTNKNKKLNSSNNVFGFDKNFFDLQNQPLENIIQDSIEIDERFKEIKMSQLNDSKFPVDSMILNPLKEKDNHIFKEINSYLDKNESEIKNSSNKNLNQNTINDSIIFGKSNIYELDNSIINNNRNSMSISQNYTDNSNIYLNNTYNDIYNQPNNRLKSTNTSMAQSEINGYTKNSINFDNNFQQNDLINYESLNNKKSLDLTNKNNNNKKLILNNISTLVSNEVSQSYVVKDGKLNDTLINKSLNVNDEFKNKTFVDKFLNKKNIEMNNLKENLYQSVGDKTQNDLNKEKVILDKLTIEILKLEQKRNDEQLRLQSNIKKDEEISIRLEIKRINDRIEQLKKDKEIQDRFVKETEAKIILKVEHQLRERIKQDQNSRFNTINNMNNSLLNTYNFNSNTNKNLNNSLVINHSKLEINNKLNHQNDANIKNSQNLNKNHLNESLNNSFLNNSVLNNVNGNLIENKTEKIKNKLSYEFEERERILHFENLEKEMLMEKTHREKERKEIERLEKLEKELTENEKIELLRRENERLEQEKQKLIRREKEKDEKLEREKKESLEIEKKRIELEGKEIERREALLREKERLENEAKEREILENRKLEKERLEREENERKRLEKEKLENEKIADLMKKLEEEKQQRIMFEEKIKKYEADKKEIENYKEKEIQENSFSKTEILNTDNNTTKRHSFKFDLLDGKKTDKISNPTSKNVNHNIQNQKNSNKTGTSLIFNNIRENPFSFRNRNSFGEDTSTSNYLPMKTCPDNFGNIDDLTKSVDNINNFDKKNNLEIQRKSDSHMINNEFVNGFINVNNSSWENEERNSINFKNQEGNKNNINWNHNNILNLNRKGENDEKKSNNFINSNYTINDKENANETISNIANKEKYSFKSHIFANKNNESFENTNNISNADKIYEKQRVENVTNNQLGINITHNSSRNKNNEISQDLKADKYDFGNVNKKLDFEILNKEQNLKSMNNSMNSSISNNTSFNVDRLNNLNIMLKNSKKNENSANISYDKRDSKFELSTSPITILGNNSKDKYVVINVNDEDDDDELDEGKFQLYQDYVNKMKDMASETKDMENNMRQFTNIIKNIVTLGSPAQIQNVN